MKQNIKSTMKWSLLPQDSSLPHMQFHLKEKGTISVLFYMTSQSPLDRILHSIANFKNLNAWKYAPMSPQICKIKKMLAINSEYREEDTAGLARKHHRGQEEGRRQGWLSKDFPLKMKHRKEIHKQLEKGCASQEEYRHILWSVWWDQKS